MASSHTGNRLLAAACLMATVLCGCRRLQDETPVATLPAAVHTAIYDTSSVTFVDFSNYGELKDLPIGIFDADSTSMTMLEAFTGMDIFDNITGERVSDGIADFAGEHFQYYTAASDAVCFSSTLFLMQDRYWDSFTKERSKIVVAGGMLSAADGLGDIKSLSDNNPAGVKVISAVDAGTRAMFDSLANDNISTFTVACLCDSSHDAVRAYSESIRKMSAENGYAKTISLISGDATTQGLAQIVDILRGSDSKAPLKVIIMDGADEGFRTGCLDLLEKYRSMFVNGTYPYRSILADDVVFVDPSHSAAVECYLTLRENRNLALRGEKLKVIYFYGF